MRKKFQYQDDYAILRHVHRLSIMLFGRRQPNAKPDLLNTQQYPTNISVRYLQFLN
jgi:hypothetical protein